MNAAQVKTGLRTTLIVGGGLFAGSLLDSPKALAQPANGIMSYRSVRGGTAQPGASNANQGGYVGRGQAPVQGAVQQQAPGTYTKAQADAYQKACNERVELANKNYLDAKAKLDKAIANNAPPAEIKAARDSLMAAIANRVVVDNLLNQANSALSVSRDSTVKALTVSKQVQEKLDTLKSQSERQLAVAKDQQATTDKKLEATTRRMNTAEEIIQRRFQQRLPRDNLGQ
jgi:hypothetical protein